MYFYFKKIYIFYFIFIVIFVIHLSASILTYVSEIEPNYLPSTL